MSVRLSEDEIWDFLAQGHTGIFTSLRRDGFPVALPVWYVALDRRIYLSGPAQTKKFARVRRDDRVSFLVESGKAWKELKAVHLNGRARVVEDPEEQAGAQKALDAKYAAFRTRQSAMPKATRGHYVSAGSTMLCIEPEGRVLSWDNKKIGLRA
jgi:nitroimidazol reductase NimA-like FMN-containing flavoprotein (pyridoxamine 5'-phosphate oxidase superfamily)